MLLIFTSCDPDWALNPRNRGYAYIINASDSEITFKGSHISNKFIGHLMTISPGDTVCISSIAWDERSTNWDKIEAAGFDPFLATVAIWEYNVRSDDFTERQQVITIYTSPGDSISWIHDAHNIDDDSIFNEKNWRKVESEESGYYKCFEWYYTFGADLSPTPDPDLGTMFKSMESWIDMSQTNKFNESLFCNDWILSKVMLETYVDGVLTEAKDCTDKWAVMEYTFNNDHRMIGMGDNGWWLYTHNCLMWKVSGGFQSYEVVKSDKDALHLKQEDYPVGGPITPYFKDKSGIHSFWILEYTVKK